MFFRCNELQAKVISNMLFIKRSQSSGVREKQKTFSNGMIFGFSITLLNYFYCSRYAVLSILSFLFCKNFYNTKEPK